VFAWRHMRMNLPGDAEYDPTLPWVFKARKDGSMAADLAECQLRKWFQ
jgi:hypothetical protein